MGPAFSVAASLSPDIRQDIGIQVLSRSQPISDLAATHQVSRKFIYQQGDKAQRSLAETFASSQGDDDVLFTLPVTKRWLSQMILGLVLICHSSYRGVVELLRDLFDTPISIGTIHNRLEAAAATAAEMNQAQDLSGIEVAACTMRFTKPINPSWWALMRLLPIAICSKLLNIEMKTPGAIISWM